MEHHCLFQRTLSCFKIDGLKSASKPTRKPKIFIVKIIVFSFQVFILFIHQKCKGENAKEKRLAKNSLYYTDKNPRFVRAFFIILYTLFAFNFITAEKMSLYNTEKKSSFVDVFLEKIINFFGKIKSEHHLSYHMSRNKKYEFADQVG